MSETKDNESIQILDRKLACENSKFFVYFDHVVDRLGDEVPRYLVVAPKIALKNLVTGTAILPLLGGKVGLIRIYRPALRGYSLEIPHGFIDPDENETTSALRELLEETGISAKDSEITDLGLITPDGGIIASRIQLFLARTEVTPILPTHEMGLREFQFYSFSEFVDMVKKSVIQDSITLAAWCKFLLLNKPLEMK